MKIIWADDEDRADEKDERDENDHGLLAIRIAIMISADDEDETDEYDHYFRWWVRLRPGYISLRHRVVRDNLHIASVIGRASLQWHRN